MGGLPELPNRGHGGESAESELALSDEVGESSLCGFVLGAEPTGTFYRLRVAAKLPAAAGTDGPTSRLKVKVKVRFGT